MRIHSQILYVFVLALICIAFVVLAPHSIERTAQAGDAERFLYGVGGLEQDGEQQFRWTGPDWGLALFGQPFGAPVLVSLHASATRPADQPLARLRLVGSPEAGAFAVAREPRVYHLLARPTEDGAGRQRIPFTGSTWTPPGDDRRQLGIALSASSVTQLGQAPLVPLAIRGLFFATLALGVSLALHQIGTSRLVAFGGGAILATGLLTLHYYDAQTLGFLLPNVWWMAAGVGVGLLAVEVRRHGDTKIRRHGNGKIALRRSPVVGRWLFAFGAALVGTIGLWLHLLPIWLGLVLALGGALFAIVDLTAYRSPLTFYSSPFIPYPLSLILIFLVALALRLFRLNDQPMALWRDEVYHAELAQHIWRDSTFRPVYVPDVDLPALLFYLISLPIGLFGADLWTLRIMPALAGALTPLALWFALRPMLGRRVALVAAWCMAVAAWSLYMSRWTFPVIFDPLLTLLAIGCLWRGLGQGLVGDTETQRHGDTETRNPSFLLHPVAWSAAGGICTGLVMYTYHTGRIEPAVVAMFALVRLGTNPAAATGWRARFKPLVQAIVAARAALPVALLAFGITVAPLAYFALTNQQAFAKRLDRVNIFNGPDAAPTAPLSVVADQLGRHALMWNVRGDQNARHYAPFRPMIDPFGGALLLVGLAMCLLRRRGVIALALLGWLAIGLVPGIFSDVAPHTMRTIGALAPACALIAIGFESMFATKSASTNQEKHLSISLDSLRFLRLNHVLTASLLAGMLVWNAGLYFAVTNDLREYYYYFETQRSLLARAAREVATDHPDVHVYLPNLLREGKVGQTTTLLLNNAQVGWLDGDHLYPAATGRSLLFLPGDLDPSRIAQAQHALGSGATLLRTGPPIPSATLPIYLVYGSNPDLQSIADQLPLP